VQICGCADARIRNYQTNFISGLMSSLRQTKKQHEEHGGGTKDIEKALRYLRAGSMNFVLLIAEYGGTYFSVMTLTTL
jgi:hypothetical protein